MEAQRHTDRRRSRRAARGLMLVLLVAGIVATPASAQEEAIAYTILPARGAGAVARLRAELGEERFAALLAVNRADALHATLLDSLVVPPKGRRLLELAPFPSTLAVADSIPTLLLVSARIQAFAAYDSGRLVRWGPVSSGVRESPTVAGAYRANWKARRHVSTFDSTWVMSWCVNLDNALGTALHAYALPGRPASHCCVRLLEPDAHWIHDWIVVGITPVLVLDAYDFEAPPPWRRLPVDPGACDLLEDVLEVEIAGRRLPGVAGG